MKRKIWYTFICLLLASFSAAAQVQIRYGKVSYNQLLLAMPEYQTAKYQMNELRKKYEAEASYNETSFKRMFAEFLQGQKEFPQNIMLKRQRDLQDAMEKGIAFRHAADSLLRQAEIDMQKPLRARLDSALYKVGVERGYECIFNTDLNIAPFLHPMMTEDATPFVLEKLNALKP